jgi:hypothetical protein
LVTAAPLSARSRRVRVRVRARVRAGRDALAQACTPARAHRNPGGEAGPLALLLRRTSSSHTSSPEPPWPRRGGLPRARGRRGGSAALLTGECAFLHQLPFPRTFEPSCGRSVRRHPWRRPKRRRAICIHPVPGQARVDLPSMHAHPSARLRVHIARPLTGKGYPRQRHRRAFVAALAPAPTTPRPPMPLVRDPSSQQP